MPKNSARYLLILAVAIFTSPLHAQSLAIAGLRSVAHQGQINAIQTDASGDLYLLLNQNDGIRLLKTDPNASQILAQTLIGTSGDIGTALALDPIGNLYLTGTTTSTALIATPSAAIPNRTDASTNSFVAKLDPNLNMLFLTFTGGSRIAASALAATADAVFVTGILYATNLPVTPNAIQQSPALGSLQNGFVEKFSASGSTLLYATYLTGALGDTTPTAIAADPSDNAYIAGSTSASGFPTISALIPTILSTPSGFLTKLSPTGASILASTFIPGPGLTSLALDPTGQTLLVSGSIALGQFPIQIITTPIIPITYQAILRLPLDFSTVETSILIAPGTQSFIAAAPNAAAWLDGPLTLPLLSLTPAANLGSAFAARISPTPSGTYSIDQIARFGGLPNQSPTYASLPITLTSIAVDPTGNPLIAGAIQPTASSSLLATETYDLPLINSPTPALPSTIANAQLAPSTCAGSLCAGSAAYLSKLTPTASTPALTLSIDDLPFLILRNLSNTPAQNLQLTPTNATLSTNCPATLPAAAECSLLLTSTTPGTLTLSASNSTTQRISFPIPPTPNSTLVFAPKELDFGIQTSTSHPATRTLTISNLGPTPQTFTSALDLTATSKTASSTSPFAQSSTDCPASAALYLLAPAASCHITLSLTAPSTPASDAILQTNWSIGTRDVLLTGYSQAASLSLSASEIDFGTVFQNGIRLPRFLYVSNPSTNSIPHTALALPQNSPFTLTDACPATLLPQTICRIRIDYLSPTAPSTDSTLLTLDQGLTALITAQTLPPPSLTAASVNPNLSIAPLTLTFPATPLTSLSATQTIGITNTGNTSFPLTLALTGDFLQTTSCPSTLAAGATCGVALTFAPTQPGARQGLLAVTAGANTTPAYVTLSGTATPILPANNGTLPLGASPIGQPAAQFYKISQSFTALTVSTFGPYSAVLIEDTGSGYGDPPSSAFSSSFTGTCFNCYLGVQFLPTAAGSQPGSLTLASTAAGSPYALALTGTGLPLTGLLLTPVIQDFGTVPIHSSSGTQLFTLTNLTGTSASLNPPLFTGDFVLTPNTQTCPTALVNTASCTLSITFSPTVTGSRSGTLTVSTPTSFVNATLTGIATSDPGLALNPLALTFSNIPGPSATHQTVTLTNTSSLPTQIGTPTTSSPTFLPSTQCATLAPGTSCTITITFMASSLVVADILSIPTTTNDVVTTYSAALSGTYTNSSSILQITPAIANFGPLPTATESTHRQFQITNLTPSNVNVSIDIPRQFALTSSPCTALPANASCTFSVAFIPLTNGQISGTLSASNSIAYTEGFATAANTLTLDAADTYSFNQVTSGQTAAHTFTLTNTTATTSSPLNIRRITSQPPFLSTSTCTAPLYLNQTCSITVTYAPVNQVAIGTASPSSTPDAGILLIESDSSTSPNVLNLKGMAGPITAATPISASTLSTFTLTQNSLTFPSTPVGDASSPQTITLTNTGNTTLNISNVLPSAGFAAQSTCNIVSPASTCTITILSSPQTTGTSIGALQIFSDSATSLEFVSLLSSATASTLTLSPTSLSFIPTRVATSQTLPLQITNASANPIILNALLLTGDYAQTTTCPLAGGLLAASASCAIQITFTPTAIGTRTGTLSIVSSASTFPLTVPLTGTGIQSQLIITPATLAFGNIAVGSASTLSLTLQNSGSAPVSNLAFALPGDYALTQSCPSTTLAPNTICTIPITFAPTALGNRTSTLTVTSSDPGSPAAIPLTGTGILGGGFTLTVNGAASASASVSSGQPASYQLSTTPFGGFTGTVALTCTPITPARYATCSLLPASITLASSSQPASATLNTITSTSGIAQLARPPVPTFLCLIFPGALIFWRRRKNLSHYRYLLAALILVSLALTLSGCGGGTNSNLRYTPPGTYQYQVTASSTTGVQVSQTVTLNLTVTAN